MPRGAATTHDREKQLSSGRAQGMRGDFAVQELLYWTQSADVCAQGRDIHCRGLLLTA